MIINPYIFGSFDPDAQAFITAANITDNTQKTAINQLVVDLKGYGIWSKMKAIYPFVGGTASTHKWNLKDPRDLDAAFRLVFNGGWTHSSTGALPNGTNAFADTKLNTNTTLTNINNHISFYSRTQVLGNMIDIACSNSNYSNVIGITQFYQNNGNKIFYAGSVNNFTISPGFPSSNTLGFQIGSRTANNNAKLYFNNSLLTTTTAIFTPVLPNFNIYISVLNRALTLEAYSSRECAFATIGDGLTDTDATNLYNTVQTFQTSLSRQV